MKSRTAILLLWAELWAILRPQLQPVTTRYLYLSLPYHTIDTYRTIRKDDEVVGRHVGTDRRPYFLPNFIYAEVGTYLKTVPCARRSQHTKSNIIELKPILLRPINIAPPIIDNYWTEGQFEPRKDLNNIEIQFGPVATMNRPFQSDVRNVLAK